MNLLGVNFALAVKKLHEDLKQWHQEMLDRKLPHRSLPEVIEEEFLPGKHSIVVSGTHGKTTTTAMLAWLFHVAKKRPNFLVGGIGAEDTVDLRHRRLQFGHAGRVDKSRRGVGVARCERRSNQHNEGSRQSHARKYGSLERKTTADA